jgi:mono/diheme cytochrome c family protein
LEQRQLHQFVIIGLGLTIIVGLALVLGLVLSRWGDPNRGANTRLNLLHQIPDEYERTKMAFVGSEVEGGPSSSWKPDGDSPTTYQAYVAYGCASCHGLAGQGATVGRPVVGLDGDIIRFFVRTGPGGMPAYPVEELSDEHLDAIIGWSSGQEPVGGAVPEVPHSLEGRADCLLCHDTGGIRPFPPNHAGRGIDVCLVCHKPAGLPPVASTPGPTPTAEPGQGAPDIPHILEGRAD